MTLIFEGSKRIVTLRRESWPIEGEFRISRGSKWVAEVIVASIQQGDALGRGEAVPYERYGETLDGTLEAMSEPAQLIARGMDRAELQSVMRPGAGRNALDCALWDLEAKLTGVPVWKLARLEEPEKVTTAFTLSIDTPDAMEARARENAERPLLKLKLGLGGDEDLERVRAVRRGAPDSRIIIDANEGWTIEILEKLLSSLAALGVELIEQPLPADADGPLRAVERLVPICADESFHHRESFDVVSGRYDMVNIKLDKTGGLTEALECRAAARDQGLGIMVGSMVCTSLGVAPALLCAQGAQVVDLDGPLLLARDRPDGLEFEGSVILPDEGCFWGGP